MFDRTIFSSDKIGVQPSYSKLLFHPTFDDTIKEINNMKIILPSNPLDLEMDFTRYSYPKNGELVSTIEEIQKKQLNPKIGEKLCTNELFICAYDESINKFLGLEGMAYLTSHSLVLLSNFDFIPISLITLYFYTRSFILTQKSKYIKHSNDPEVDSKRDYVSDRNSFLINNIPNNSIAFIDGPLIGGQISSYTLELNDKLLKRNIIPIFFVKNSTSNLIVNNIKEIKGKFNSDMHWSYRFLKRGERTNLFMYVDRYNKKNAKIFCYLKAFDTSPHRIEIDINTYKKHNKLITHLLDVIYYLLLAQGDLKNPQIRPIAIAEKYARSTIRLINFTETMKYLGITPTMDQERFG